MNRKSMFGLAVLALLQAPAPAAAQDESSEFWKLLAGSRFTHNSGAGSWNFKYVPRYNGRRETGPRFPALHTG